jgi:uncharacterized zinc-type alcohol dehydrogenase-like protein
MVVTQKNIVVDEKFVLRVPENLDLAGVAPLLCAGITTYSPIRRWGDIKGKKVGVVGLGGLGHMGVKFARAFGAHVVVFTTSPNKKEDAVRLGAHEVIISTNPEDMQKHAGSFDFILDTISAEHDINAYINMLGLEGNITLVGAPPRRCLIFAVNTTSPPMLKSSRSRRSTKHMSDWLSRMLNTVSRSTWIL